MKNAYQKLILIVLAIATIFSLVTNVSAFGWRMDVGESHSLAYSDTPYVSSNPSVVQIRTDGNNTQTAIAVGEGTATITGGTWMNRPLDAYEITVIGSDETQNSSKTWSNVENPFDMLANSKIGSTVTSHFSTFRIFFLIVLTLVVLIFALVILSLQKCKRLDNAMQTLAARPCQQAAEDAVQEFSNTNALVRLNISGGGDRGGVHFSQWRYVFNDIVIPSKNIRWETKNALRSAMIRLNTYGLYPVKPMQSAQAPTSPFRPTTSSSHGTQTPEEARAAAEAFGAGGEAHVWHNLKSLPGCDVYRNVKIYSGNTRSEIDAVIVDPSKGVFLVETKSAGGAKMADGQKVIIHHLLKEDPRNQIYRHEADFKRYFADLGIDHKIKNILVFSWPNGDIRRTLDRSSFPQTDYDVITVEQLISYHRTQSGVVLSDYERSILAARLKPCCSEYSIH